MAVKLIANYAKRLGLPGYSSHQFSVSVESELTDVTDVETEVSRIYTLLQDSVDAEIQKVGFVPDEVYGVDHGPGKNGSHSSNGQRPVQRDGAWNCSDKQKQFILKLISDHDLDRNAIEELATDRFGHGLPELNKLEASGLIEELLETYTTGGSKRRSNGSSNGNGGYRRFRAGAKGGRS